MIDSLSVVLFTSWFFLSQRSFLLWEGRSHDWILLLLNRGLVVTGDASRRSRCLPAGGFWRTPPADGADGDGFSTVSFLERNLDRLSGFWSRLTRSAGLLIISGFLNSEFLSEGLRLGSSGPEFFWFPPFARWTVSGPAEWTGFTRGLQLPAAPSMHLSGSALPGHGCLRRWLEKRAAGSGPTGAERLAAVQRREEERRSSDGR